MKDLDATFFAVLKIWDELPRLIGPEYASVHWQLLDKLRQIHDAEPDDRADRIFELLDSLEPFPETWEQLRAVRRETEKIRHDAEARGEVPVFDDEPVLYGPVLRERQRPPKLVRYTDVTAPRRLPVGERGVITVGLLPEPSGDSVATRAVELVFERRVEVHLIAVSPALEILETRVRTLDLRLTEEAPQRAAFLVRARTAGRKHLRLDFLQAGELLLRLPISIEAISEATAVELTALATAKLESSGLEAPPSDLEFRVAAAQEEGFTRLHYTLSSPTGVLDAFFLDIEGPEIKSSLEDYREQLLASLDEMREDAALDDAARTRRMARIHRRLLGIGEEIRRELLPSEAGRFFDELEVDRLKTVHIVSDEPWIPWELLRLGGDSADGALLCEKLAVTRWLAGERSPVRSLDVSRVLRIAAGPEPEAGGDPLPALAKAAGAVTRVVDSATLHDVEEVLDLAEVADLWHLEAPAASSSDGQRVGIRFDGGTLWPEDFDWHRRQRIAARRPVVFWNVAGAGRLGRGVTRLEGWAPLWVDRCGCGVFVAPISRVDEKLERLFCQVFYEALGRGEPFGQALLAARDAARSESASDPAWAVYSAYGHPNARIRFVEPAEGEG